MSRDETSYSLSNTLPSAAGDCTAEASSEHQQIPDRLLQEPDKLDAALMSNPQLTASNQETP